MKRLSRAVLLLLLALACAHVPSEGAVHVVQRGENLYRIALHYGVTVGEIAEANGIRDPRALEVGMRLVSPGARGAAPERPLVPELDADAARLALGWPTYGVVTSRFGWRNGRGHEGLDIGAKPGTPVWAASAGRVVFSGRLGDYGRVVVVRHDAVYSTVYAHNRKNFASKGDRVVRGDVIAEVGQSGNATGPHLHFEVRRGETPRDPLRYLP